MLDFNYNSNHIEGNTLTYSQTEVLLLMGEVIGSAKMKDLEDMKAHNLCLALMKEEAITADHLSESFIKRLHQVMLREDYTVYRELPGGRQTSYVVHAGTYGKHKRVKMKNGHRRPSNYVFVFLAMVENHSIVT